MLTTPGAGTAVQNMLLNRLNDGQKQYFSYFPRYSKARESCSVSNKERKLELFTPQSAQFKIFQKMIWNLFENENKRILITHHICPSE